MHRIGALIPAAGRSLRMGRSKPLLPLGDSDFVGRILQTLVQSVPEVAPLVVVCREGDGDLARRLSDAQVGPLRVVTVDDGPGDMLRSLRAGAEGLGEALGALVWPVDVPAVSGGTVAAVARAAAAQPNRVVMPRCGGQTGHPTYVPRALLGAESEPGSPPGLRGILTGAQTAAVEVAVEDPFSLWNVNTPEAYQRLLDAL